MIFSSIYANDGLEKYPEPIREAITYLTGTDFTNAEPGTYELHGRDMYALLMDAETVPVEKKRVEAHRDYLDIQYTVSGREKLGFAPYHGDEKILEEKEEKDIYFFDNPENESFLISTGGCYSIFFPNDLHRPACAVEGPEKVRKVVVKISMDLLKK